MTDLPLVSRRRGLRRPFRGYCDAIAIEDGRVLGERLIDLSPRGALVAMDEAVAVGDRMLLSFQMPWLGPIVHVRAVVERVVEGWRRGDPGYCAGVRFLDLKARDRLELARRLAPFPRTRPARPHPADYARQVRGVEVGVEVSVEVERAES